MVRAVIADDSGVMREILTEILEDGGIDVVASTKDGENALEAILEHKPDVATIDIDMPRMDGHELIERVMDERPTPMIVISATAGERTEETFEALELGAVDFFAKPSGEMSIDIWSKREEITEKVKATAKVDPAALRTPADGEDAREDASAVEVDRRFPGEPTLVIGASTGGPKVVERVLAELPERAGLRILVVQHMADHYTGRFAQRLDERSGYEIREARERDRVGPGEGVVAKGGSHLEVTGFHNGEVSVCHDDGPKRHNVRPAIDVTMETAARTVTGNLLGVIMTGMGADGAEGLAAIKEAGGKAIVQDEETSRVYGMPKVAAETVEADMVLPEGRIAEGITNAFRGWSA